MDFLSEPTYAGETLLITSDLAPIQAQIDALSLVVYPIVGIDGPFPSSPVRNETFARDGEFYIWDEDRALWLSTGLWQREASSAATVAIGSALGVGSYAFNFHAIIVSARCCRGSAATDPTFRVLADGVSVYGVDITSGLSRWVDELAVEIPAGRVVSFDIADGTLTDGGSVQIDLRRKGG